MYQLDTTQSRQQNHYQVTGIQSYTGQMAEVVDRNQQGTVCEEVKS